MDVSPPFQSSPTETPRARRFRLELVKEIPKLPNNRETKRILEAKSLAELLIDYVNWRARFIGVRPRKVVLDPEIVLDAKWAEHAESIAALFKKVERGDDLTPHLSLEPHSKGYAHRAELQGTTSDDKWSDKDFLLHGMNYHHFHLGQVFEGCGHVQRTNNVLFAEVSREEFVVVGIFDHSVFVPRANERERLWELHDRIAIRGKPAGSIIVSAAIATSGHTVHCVRYAAHCARLVQHCDSMLDDRNFVESMFAQASIEAPSKARFVWGFNHLDIGVVEKSTGRVFYFSKGWN